MEKTPIIISMTTWPPRAASAVEAMQWLMTQQHDAPVRFVLTLSRDEWNSDGARPLLPSPSTVLTAMQHLGVEVIWDEGNTLSHKKLMPVLERYGESTVIVVDDDVRQRDGWLQAMINDHRRHPTDIIYGSSSSLITIMCGKIYETRGLYTRPGEVTFNEKPANGASGTLYPPGTFTDNRFFDRSAYMRLSPTSDETWQWAWAVMEGRTYRCMPECNIPLPLRSNQECALFQTNMGRYDSYHNAIAAEYPSYTEALEAIIRKKENIKIKKL